jgi:AP-3 complex subunit delta
VKYVALLALNKIVSTHPLLVAEQGDAIMECIDSADITIRIKALDLVQGMVSADNLVSIVSRLMKQLKASSISSRSEQHPDAPKEQENGDDSDMEEKVNLNAPKAEAQAPPLPEDYQVDVIGRILAMCSHDNYSSLADFDWYIDVLTQLVRMAPAARDLVKDALSSRKATSNDISEKIGDELRNVAVKVKAMRGAAVRAADLIIAQMNADTPPEHSITSLSLKSIAWVVGEYALQLSSPDDTLSSLLNVISRTTTPEILTTTLQATTKIFALIAGDAERPWTAERKSIISLLMARIIHVFEPLSLHPNLEVQERAVEFIELLKLTAEAVSGQSASTNEVQQDPPLLLTQAIPSLFSGWELNSVSVGAQRNVPVPDGLDMDAPIHSNLEALLAEAGAISLERNEADDFDVYYYQRPPPTAISSSQPAIERLPAAPEQAISSYQQPTEDSYLDADIVARRKAERAERNRDDPFYIGEPGAGQRTSTPIHNILSTENGPDLDIDSIPIMQLDLNNLGSTDTPSASSKRPRPRPMQKVIIAADETLSGPSTPRNYESENNSDSFTKSRSKKLKQSLLQVSSSSLGFISLEGGNAAGGTGGGSFDFERQQREEAEMALAMKEVEKLRLEMQRANERIQVAQGMDAEGTVVKKKAKKKKGANPAAGAAAGTAGDDGAANVIVKKKKKAKPAVIDGEDSGVGGSGAAANGEALVVKKKKKKKPLVEFQGVDG